MAPAFSDQNSDLYQGIKKLLIAKIDFLFFKKMQLKSLVPQQRAEKIEVDLNQNNWIILHCSAANLENNLGHQIVKFCHEKEQYFQLLLNNEIGSTAMQNYPTILA